MTLHSRLAVVGMCAMIAVAAGSTAVPLRGQAVEARASRMAQLSDLEQLRIAADHERNGDLDAAERTVLEILSRNAMSVTALLRLEGILELQGRLEDMLPHVERLLERDVASVIGQQLRLRVLHALDRPDDVATAVTAWVRATPRIETPYREGALIWRERGEYERAIALLEEGRSRIQLDDALALELGDAHIAAGDARRAAEEWSRAIGDEGRGLMLVQRRMQQLPDAGASVIPGLLEQLGAGPASIGRQRAATLLAIEAGLGVDAQSLAQVLVTSADSGRVQPLLVEVARQADGAGLDDLAIWAYGELVVHRPADESMLAIRNRIAELSLRAGDTARAAAVYRELEHAAAPGSPQRRQAIALRIQLISRDGDVAAAAVELASFRREYPQAAELDETAAAVAQAHLDADRPDAAAAALAGVRGVHSARLRGRLLLRNGDIDGARDELLAAAPLLRGAEATETIALAALLIRVSPAGGDLIASVVAALDDEREATLADAVASAGRLPARERSAVLDFLATHADRAGLDQTGEDIRRIIVDDLPASDEAPAALLALATRAKRQAETAEARVLLEKLIMEYPRSALLPRARNELQQMGK